MADLKISELTAGTPEGGHLLALADTASPASNLRATLTEVFDALLGASEAPAAAGTYWLTMSGSPLSGAWEEVWLPDAPGTAGTYRLVMAGSPLAASWEEDAAVILSSPAPSAGDVPKWDAGEGAFVPGDPKVGQPADVFVDYPGTPEADEVILRAKMGRDIAFNADFAGSQGVVAANPTSSFVLTVKNGATTIGTVTVSTGGAFTFATTSGTAKTVAIGEVLTVVAPASADATVAGIAVTLLGVTA